MNMTAPMMEDARVEEDLWADLRVYGRCFWRTEDGRKIRVHPREVVFDRDGNIIAPKGNIQGKKA